MPLEPEAMAKAKKIQPDSFAAAYPNIADWVLGGGWIEVGTLIIPAPSFGPWMKAGWCLRGTLLSNAGCGA
jgi:hypothetical protein